MASGENPRAGSSSTPPDASVSSELSPSILEQAIAETMASASLPLQAGEMDALLEVARRHRGKPFAFEPVAVEMVAAVLQRQFREQRAHLPPVQWQIMCRDIANTLFDTPTTHERLKILWGQLGELVK